MPTKHGVYTTQAATGVSTPSVADSGIPFVVGAAPVQSADNYSAAALGLPVLCTSFAEAKAALGYSDPPNFLRGILWGIPDAPFVSVLLLSVGYSTKETTAPHQPPGTGAHLERYRENPCRTRFCPRPPVSILAGNCGLPQGLVPTGRNSSRTAGGNRQADAQKGCPAGTGRP